MTAARSGSGKDGERMKAKIFDNLLFKILALLMAVLLWVVVVNIDDAVSYKKISGVKVNLINTDVLTSQDQTIRVEEGTDTVNLTVYARSSVLKSLKAEDFSATADTGLWSSRQFCQFHRSVRPDNTAEKFRRENAPKTDIPSLQDRVQTAVDAAEELPAACPAIWGGSRYAA